MRLIFIIVVVFLVSCKSDRYLVNDCNVFDSDCDVQICEKFQDALVTIQLSYDQYPISLSKVQQSIQFLEITSGIKSHVNSLETPVYSNRTEMVTDLLAWINWLRGNGCEAREPIQQK